MRAPRLTVWLALLLTPQSHSLFVPNTTTELSQQLDDCLHVIRCDTGDVWNRVYNDSAGNSYDCRVKLWDIKNVLSFDYLFQNFGSVLDGCLETDKMSAVIQQYQDWTWSDFCAWDTSHVISMRQIFDSSRFPHALNISCWNTSNVQDMSAAFRFTDFQGELTWDTRNVKDMSFMFSFNSKFNQPLHFDTSNVNNMKQMFYGAGAFNQPLHFDTSNVKDMQQMFARATNFNQDIGNWDVGHVQSFYQMFAESAFNQDLSNWQISDADIRSMFASSKMNQSLASWRPTFKEAKGYFDFLFNGLSSNPLATPYDLKSDQTLPAWAAFLFQARNQSFVTADNYFKEINLKYEVYGTNLVDPSVLSGHLIDYGNPETFNSNMYSWNYEHAQTRPMEITYLTLDVMYQDTDSLPAIAPFPDKFETDDRFRRAIPSFFDDTEGFLGARMYFDKTCTQYTSVDGGPPPRLGTPLLECKLYANSGPEEGTLTNLSLVVTNDCENIYIVDRGQVYSPVLMAFNVDSVSVRSLNDPSSTTLHIASYSALNQIRKRKFSQAFLTFWNDEGGGKSGQYEIYGCSNEIKGRTTYNVSTISTPDVSTSPHLELPYYSEEAI